MKIKQIQIILVIIFLLQTVFLSAQNFRAATSSIKQDESTNTIDGNMATG